MNSSTPVVFLVDDDVLVLKVVGCLLRAAGFKVAAFASALEFLAAYDPAVPGCLVLDMAMPGLSGLELQQALTTCGSELPIIFHSGRADVTMCAQAFKCGAADFLTKPAPHAELVAAVHRALENNRSVRQARAEVDDIRARTATLTPREREVLAYVIKGYLNKQTAAALGTVEKTIKVHRGRMMEKMRVVSVAELVRLVAKCGDVFHVGDKV